MLFRISPTWQVMAVHGAQPTRVEMKQSMRGIRIMPDAIFIPDQGTMPTRRRRAKRTQVASGLTVDEVEAVGLASMTFFVACTALGMRPSIQRLMQRDKRVEARLPAAVSRVITSVPVKPPHNAPAITLMSRAPGMLHACFQTAIIERAATMCTVGRRSSVAVVYDLTEDIMRLSE